MHNITSLVSVQARVGTNTYNKGGVKYDIYRSIAHDGYDPRSRVHDIALVQLRGLIRWNSQTAAIALSDIADAEAGVAVKLAGWGATTQPKSDAKGKSSELLQVLSTRIVANAQCKARLNSVNMGRLLQATNVCAGGTEGKGACHGDLGSPLVGPGNDLVGLLSFGSLPCGSRVPDVFTRVYKYVAWIKSTIRNKQIKDRN